MSMTDTAFKATYVDHRPVKTRSVVQFVFEVPVEQADAALAVLGGFARPAEERWVAIARLEQEAKRPPSQLETLEKTKRKWGDIPYSQQAGILCSDTRFAEFFAENFPHCWDRNPTLTEAVKDFCQVDSRAKILPLSDASQRWIHITNRYRDWCRLRSFDPFEHEF
jgi:hypothetical protein